MVGTEKSSRNPTAKAIYHPVGNFLFLTNDTTIRQHDTIDFDQNSEIERKMELLDSITFSDQIQSSNQDHILRKLSVSHEIDSYYELLGTWRTAPIVFPDIVVQEAIPQGAQLRYESLNNFHSVHNE